MKLQINEVINLLDSKTLDHPARLKIYLTLRKHATNGVNKPLSIRDLQKILGVESTSTVIWHLEKMIDGGYVTKQQDNRHILTPEALEQGELKVPLNIPITMLKGKIIPKRLLLLSFIISSVVIGLIFLLIDFRLATIFLFLALIVTSCVIIWEYWAMYQELENYFGA